MPSSSPQDDPPSSMLVAELSLGADPRSAGAARRFLATTLTSWKTSLYGEDAVLLLSELVANAALHAMTQIGVRIELKADCLRLAVTDGSPHQPVVRHYSEEASTGRGLAMVTALALRWGVDANADGTKTVWAELGTDPARRRPEDTVSDVRSISDFRRTSGRAGPPQGDQDTTSRLRTA